MLSANGRELLRDVEIVLPELKFIEYLAGRGGEIPWNWAACTPPAKAMIATLINKQILIEREYVTHAAQAVGSLHLRLTDQGRLVAEQIEKMAIQGAKTATAPEPASA